MSDAKRGRSLTKDEDALWRGVARSVKPLRPRIVKRVAETAAAPVAGKPKPIAKSNAKPVSLQALPRSVAVPPSAPPPTTLDRKTKKKLARGREDIDARLDLHGMTQAEAHAALSHFLHRVQASGGKFVIVVTGKGGRGEGERGVLRRQVPLWLKLPEFRGLVVGFETAHIGHGGEGALYVRVRRAR